MLCLVPLAACHRSFICSVPTESVSGLVHPFSEERLASLLRTDGIEVNRERPFKVVNDELRQEIPTIKLSLSHLAQG